MPTTKKLNALKINKLTEAQLAAATVNEDELYLVTDAENPVTVKTDKTLTGNGLAATPLSVSPALSAVSVQTTLDSGLPFLDESGSQMWRMGPGKTLYAAYVGTGNTVGIIGGEGATLDAVYAAKLCKDSTELSVRDGKSGDIAVTSELPEAKTGTAGQVYTKTADGAAWQDATGGGSGTDNNGLEGDYCSKYGIVDETASGLPTQGTGNQIEVPAQLVMDIPGVPGLTTNSTAITHDLVSTTDCEIFLAEGTVIEATKTYWQTTEPEDGQTGYLAWWNGTEWKFKSNDTGNVWRAANAVRIAKCIFTDGSLTRLCFTGCRVLNKQEWLPKSGITQAGAFQYDWTIGTTLLHKYYIFMAASSDDFELSVNGKRISFGYGTIGKINSETKHAYSLRHFDDGEGFIGTKVRPWDGIYVKTINGGADNAAITVPTTGGTMVVATPPTTAGNYVLKATVAEDGTVTTQWVAEV